MKPTKSFIEEKVNNFPHHDLCDGAYCCMDKEGIRSALQEVADRVREEVVGEAISIVEGMEWGGFHADKKNKLAAERSKQHDEEVNDAIELLRSLQKVKALGGEEEYDFAGTDCCKECFPRGEEGCEDVRCDCHIKKNHQPQGEE